MLLEKIQKENDIKQLKPEELEKLAESVLVIEKGKEKYFGSPKNFLSNYQNI